MKNVVLRQFMKFVFVGVLNTTVSYVLYYVFLHLRLPYLLALSLSYPLGIIHSFYWNKYWTFGSKDTSHGLKIRFVVVYGVMFLLNAVVLTLLVEFAGMTPQIGGLLALFVTTVLSFCGHKFWSFTM